jgi:lysyl-tRNA synthetase class 1
MQWLNKIVDELAAGQPEGEILIESGSSPSGTYHFGHMRELMICDAILLELKRRGRQTRHVQFVDDLDSLRKIPYNVPAEYEKYLGYPICDIPAPDGSERSYADYFLQGLMDACAALNIEVEFVRSHERYRSGWMVPAIERALDHVPEARKALETISGRKLDEHWTPVQVMEDGRLKNRKFVDMNKDAKLIRYEDSEGKVQPARYDKGEVKLDWRLDWPGRWWLQSVAVEPSGRDHMTKGSSYDTGVRIVRDVYGGEPPIAVAYDFINMAGDTKKMSASKGTGLDALEAAELMPPEVMRFYVFRAPPLKRLYFDPVNGVVQVMDEFAAFAAKEGRTADEEQLLDLSTRGLSKKTVSRVPFSHLVASYQASLRNEDRTLEVLRRTEYARTVDEDAGIIKAELRFIRNWLDKRAPEEVRFSLLETVDVHMYSEQEKAFFKLLGSKVAGAPEDADGAWFHDAIYELKDGTGLMPKEMFGALYRLLIGKTSGPRAGYFLSILPRDWLLKRLNLEA